MESKLTGMDIYQLCVQNRWFTCGGNEQYARVMKAADDGMDVHDLAIAIWICSYDVELKDIINTIEDYLQ